MTTVNNAANFHYRDLVFSDNFQLKANQRLISLTRNRDLLTVTVETAEPVADNTLSSITVQVSIYRMDPVYYYRYNLVWTRDMTGYIHEPSFKVPSYHPSSHVHVDVYTLTSEKPHIYHIVQVYKRQIQDYEVRIPSFIIGDIYMISTNDYNNDFTVITRCMPPDADKNRLYTFVADGDKFWSVCGLSNKKVGSLSGNYESDSIDFKEDLLLMKCNIPIIKPNSGGKYYSNTVLRVNYEPCVLLSEFDANLTSDKKQFIKHTMNDAGRHIILVSYFTRDWQECKLIKFLFDPFSHDLNYDIHTELNDNRSQCIVIPNLTYQGFLSIKERPYPGYRNKNAKFKPHSLVMTVLHDGKQIPLTVTKEFGTKYDDITTANLITDNQLLITCKTNIKNTLAENTDETADYYMDEYKSVCKLYYIDYDMLTVSMITEWDYVEQFCYYDTLNNTNSVYVGCHNICIIPPSLVDSEYAKFKCIMPADGDCEIVECLAEHIPSELCMIISEYAFGGFDKINVPLPHRRPFRKISKRSARNYDEESEAELD